MQLAGNLSLPGGFQLGAFGSEYCDVVTATGDDDDDDDDDNNDDDDERVNQNIPEMKACFCLAPGHDGKFRKMFQSILCKVQLCSHLALKRD